MPSNPPLPEFGPHSEPRLFVTADFPPVGGRIKVRPEDFLVEELPLYQAGGEGEHIYLFVEKRGLPTMSMLGVIARHFGVRIGDVGYAGLKDKHAVTRQLVSVHVPGRAISDFGALEHDRVTILWADRHVNKLRRGHLAGNRFIIRIRDVDPVKAVHASKVLQRLAVTGVPNRAGEQRFGAMGNNHLVGRAILLGDWRGALDLLLGPTPRASAFLEEPRRLYAAGNYAAARAAYPSRFHTERRALAALEKGAGPKRAMAAIGHMQRRYFLTAFQSAVFNAVLDARLESGTLARLVPGDLAWKHDNGAVFRVPPRSARDSDGDLAGRLERLEVSPSGPMWGADMTRAGGQVDEAELGALTATGVAPDDLAALAARSRGDIEGARKPLRVPLTLPDVEGGVDEHGPYIRCAFELPRGAFATVVMSEVMKAGQVSAEANEDDED